MDVNCGSFRLLRDYNVCLITFINCARLQTVIDDHEELNNRKSICLLFLAKYLMNVE